MTKQLVRHALLTLVLLATTFRPAAAKVAPVGLGTLVGLSELIVVGQVAEVSVDERDPYAVVNVEERWLGTTSNALVISLRPTWPCDISTALPGEHVILFLARDEYGRWHISHSGHGRMPIVAGRAAVSPLVLLRGEKWRDGEQAVPIDDLRRMVVSKLKKAKQ
jgi:hypothetical protein